MRLVARRSQPPPAGVLLLHLPATHGNRPIQVDGGRWNEAMGEFILDYGHVRTSQDPEAELHAFLDSAYDAGATLAGWDPALLGSGKPSEAG